ncbi:MAG: hypothetical protein AABZ15_03770 [Nitrospirota bacterium]
MKRSLRILCVVLFGMLPAVSLSSCGGGGASGGNGGGGGNTITIKGNFAGGTHVAKSPWLNRLLAWIIPPAHALNQNAVIKIMAFHGNGGYSVSNVTDGSFSIAVETGSPIGLISVGANNSYLGYLTLQNGVDSIPLTKLGQNVNTIDLQTLSSSSSMVTPSYNPLGSELPLTSAEQIAIAQGDNFFASLIKNPDADGNGTIDFLDGKFFRPYITYFITGGTFGASLTPTVTTPAPIDGFRFGLHAKDATRPGTVYFTGPGGSGLSNAASAQPPLVNTDSTAYGSPYVTAPAIPPAGQYLVSYKTSTLTFDISDQSSAPSNIILAVPTVTLNGNGTTINKVTWVYKPGSGGGATLDPLAVISSVMLQIEGNGTPCASYQQGLTRIYNAENLPATTVEHVLACQNLLWSNVTQIFMAYNDVYGNHNVVTWNK